MLTWLAKYDKRSLSLLSDLDTAAASIVSRDNFVPLAYLSVTNLNKKHIFATCLPADQAGVLICNQIHQAQGILTKFILPKLSNAKQISS